MTSPDLNTQRRLKTLEIAVEYLLRLLPLDVRHDDEWLQILWEVQRGPA